MLNTNDVYNDAVRGSSIHADENTGSIKPLTGSKIVATLLLTSLTLVGFNFYGSINSADTDLVVKKDLVVEIQTESELLVSSQRVATSEEAYLSALREIETELTEERENINLDTSEQMNLSSAMTNIMDDEFLADNTKYTNALRKEIGVEVNEREKSFTALMSDFTDVVPTTNLKDTKEVSKNDNDMSLRLAMNELMDDSVSTEKVTKETRVVVVKKGDTLQGISNKFYGDAMNYKRIVASNDSLRTSDTIYEGQTILLPY